MTTVDEVQSLFVPLRINVSSESDDRYFLDWSGKQLYILKSEIDEYFEKLEKIVSEPETSLFYPGYYEHLIEYQARISSIRWRNLGVDGDSRIYSQEKTLYLEISRATTLFILHAIQNTASRIGRQRSFNH